MSNDIPIAAVRRKSSRAAFITAAGFFIIVAVIGFSIWQIHKLQGDAAELRAQIEQGNVELDEIRDNTAQEARKLNTLMRARGLAATQAPAALIRAAEVVNAVLLDEPGDVSARYLLAEILYWQGNFQGALAEMRQAFTATTAATEEAPAIEGTDSLLEYRVRLITYLCATNTSEHLAEARTRLRDTETMSRLSQDASLGSGNEDLTRHCASLGADLANAIHPMLESARGGEEENLFDIRQVFLHIRNDADRARAMEIGRSLCEAGYFMPGIELVSEPRAYPQEGSVHFYYPAQDTQAASITQSVRAAAQQQGVSAWSALPAPRALSGFSDLPGDRVEVWLPPLAPEAAATSAAGQRGFRCTPLIRVAEEFNGLTATESAQRNAARVALASALQQQNDARLNAALIEAMASATGVSRYQVQIGGANALSRMQGPIPMNNRARALDQLRAMRASTSDPRLQQNLDAAIGIVSAQ